VIRVTEQENRECWRLNSNTSYLNSVVILIVNVNININININVNINNKSRSLM